MTLPLAHVDDRLAPAVWKLLRIRLVISIRSFKRAKIGKKIGLILLYLFLFSLVVGVFVGSYFLLGFLLSKDFADFIGNPMPFLRSLPTMLISAAMFIIFLTSFGVLLSALYLSGDMDFLLSTPVPIRAVFVSKLLQAILPNFGLLSLLILPVLFGLGAALGFNFLYFPMTLIVIAALALSVASLASLLVMVLARYISPRRLAEVLAFFAGIISFTLGQSGNFYRAINPDISESQVTTMLQGFTRFNTPWSPLAWAGQGLVGVGEGSWEIALVFLVLTLGFSVGIFAITLVAAEKLYYSGWARVQSNALKKKHPRPAKAAATAQPGRAARIIPAPIRAVIVKDFRVLRRDLRNLSQLMTPLILGVMYGFAILRQGTRVPLGQGNAPEWVNVAITSGFSYADIGIAIFVGWILLMSLAGRGFSQEGKSFWMLKSSPLNAGQLLSAKFWVAWIPPVVIGWIFLLAFAVLQPAKLPNLPFSMLAVGLCFAGATSISEAFGVVGARFDWTDPRKMQGGITGCFSSLVCFIYMGFSILFLVAPALALPALGLPAYSGQVAGLLVGGAICLACAVVPLRMVRNRVDRLNES
jgi:ABC-2 type transport system permease protein